MPRTAKRRQRAHDVLPAGFKWRGGRPRWEPSPTRRRQGWKGLDLKDAWGKWLGKAQAIARADQLAGAVAAWARGDPVASAFVHVAPRGAELKGASTSALSPRSIGALLDGWYAHPAFTKNAARTQGDYRNKLNRFLQLLARPAGAHAGAPVSERQVEKVRALDVDVLLPPPFGDDGEFELERIYELLEDEAGLPMANGVLACVSAWLGWCVRKKRVWPSNPAELVERRAADGRIVVYDWPEILALVQAAEAKGLRSIADALVLAVDLSWSQQDLLAMTWGQVSDDGHVRHRRIKTGNAGNPRLLRLGQARMAEIHARWAAQSVRPTHVLVCELTGQPWNSHTFRHEFAQVRAAAARALRAAGQPEAAEALQAKQFRDLRDTAITYMYEAGLDIPGICSRSLHDPKHAEAVIAKHYGAIRQGLADDAADRLDAHFAERGYTLGQLLALPAPGRG